MRGIVGQPQHVRQPVARIRHLPLRQIDQFGVDPEALKRGLQLARDPAYLLRDFGVARPGRRRPTRRRSRGPSPASSARDMAVTIEAYWLISCAGAVIGIHAAARAARILSIFSFSVAAVKGLMT